jgi:hypothetical protein
MASKRTKYFRVAHPGAAAVFSPEAGDFLVPDPSLSYPEDHQIVRLAPWMFSEIGRSVDAPRREAVPVETATSRPGAKRMTPPRAQA